MSLNRLFLRLAVVNALSPQPGDDHPPTMAGDAVFDTRLDDISSDQDNFELPLIEVYTGDDEYVNRDVMGGNINMRRHLMVHVQITVASFQAITAPDGSKLYDRSAPTTDAELEATLDMFEWQVHRTLKHPFRKASVLLQRMVTSWDSHHSEVARDASKNNRLASRILTFRLEVKPDCMPRYTMNELNKVVGTPQFEDASYLNEFIKVLERDERYAGLLDALREASTGEPMLRVNRLQRVGLQVNTERKADPHAPDDPQLSLFAFINMNPEP